MKTGIKMGCGIAAIVVIYLISMQVIWFRSYSNDWQEAEPLVQIVWPLAGEMEEYYRQKKKLPRSLDEMIAFSKDFDFEPLRKYSPVFSDDPVHLFFLRVNGRHAFRIDKDFSPHWAKPEI